MENINLKYEENDDYAWWTYGEISIIGRIGTCDFPLKRWKKQMKNAPIGKVEFGRVLDEGDINFLGIFCYQPQSDLTFTLNQQKRLSVVAFTLESEVTNVKKTIETFFEKTGTVPSLPTSELINSIWSEINAVELKNYVRCIETSESSNRPFKDIFGYLRYAGFLMNYKGVNPKKALRDSLQVWGMDFII
jgi:hypothetical protein